MKYTREFFWSHKTPMRKNVEPWKYPLEKTSDHEGTMARWHATNEI